MREGFNEKAMENKIRLNLEKGWSIKGMYLASLREKEKILKSIQTLEARDAELQDQIEYLKENYAKSIGLHCPASK